MSTALIERQRPAQRQPITPVRLAAVPGVTPRLCWLPTIGFVEGQATRVSAGTNRMVGSPFGQALQQGSTGSGLRFADYLNTAGPITAIAVFYVTDTSTTQVMIGRTRESSPFPQTYALYTSLGEIRFQSSADSYLDRAAMTGLTANTLYCAVGTYSGVTKRRALFVNGLLRDARVATGTPTLTGSQTTHIGGEAGNLNNFPVSAGGVLMVYVADGAMDDATAAAISGNPWALFEETYTIPGAMTAMVSAKPPIPLFVMRGSM